MLMMTKRLVIDFLFLFPSAVCRRPQRVYLKRGLSFHWTAWTQSSNSKRRSWTSRSNNCLGFCARCDCVQSETSSGWSKSPKMEKFLPRIFSLVLCCEISRDETLEFRGRWVIPKCRGKQMLTAPCRVAVRNVVIVQFDNDVRQSAFTFHPLNWHKMFTP